MCETQTWWSLLLALVLAPWTTGWLWDLPSWISTLCDREKSNLTSSSSPSDKNCTALELSHLLALCATLQSHNPATTTFCWFITSSCRYIVIFSITWYTYNLPLAHCYYYDSMYQGLVVSTFSLGCLVGALAAGSMSVCALKWTTYSPAKKERNA